MTIDSITKRAASVWRCILSIYRRCIPGIMLCTSIMIAYAIGTQGVSMWWLIPVYLLGGFAIGAAEDRAEARAKTEWSDRFWSLIESDHEVVCTVTHRTADIDKAVLTMVAQMNKEP